MEIYECDRIEELEKKIDSKMNRLFEAQSIIFNAICYVAVEQYNKGSVTDKKEALYLLEKIKREIENLINEVE